MFDRKAKQEPPPPPSAEEQMKDTQDAKGYKPYAASGVMQQGNGPTVGQERPSEDGAKQPPPPPIPEDHRLDDDGAGTRALDEDLDTHLIDPRATSGVTANPMNAQTPQAPNPALVHPAFPVDDRVAQLQEKWPSAEAMVVDLEAYAVKSHGLAPDLDVIRDVALYLRAAFHIVTPPPVD